MACQWCAVTGLTNADADLIGRRSVERDSWNDLATADTPEFLNSKAGEILSTSPQQTPCFFGYIYCTCGRVSTPHRINLPARGIYAPAQDGWPGQCKTPVGNHGCLTHRQEHGTRQLPLWPVVDSSCCLRLASAPPWVRLPPLIH
jgi:hypothetical protein